MPGKKKEILRNLIKVIYSFLFQSPALTFAAIEAIQCKTGFKIGCIALLFLKGEKHMAVDILMTSQHASGFLLSRKMFTFSQQWG